MATNSNLVPVRVINSLGVETTVHRKAPGVASPGSVPAPRITGDLTSPQSRKAIVSERLTGMGLSKSAAGRIARKTARMDEESVESLLDLLDQPDPHNRFLTSLLGYFEPHYDRDADILAMWLRDSRDHYHAVESVIHEMYYDKDAMSDMIGRVTKQVMEGLHHYREGGEDYTPEQLRDLATVIAVAECALICLNSAGEIPTANIIGHENTYINVYEPERSCLFIKSRSLRELIASSSDTAQQILRLIAEEHTHTESSIRHRLEGLPKVLTSGTL